MHKSKLEDIDSATGIYSLHFIKNPMVRYVESSINIKRRIIAHFERMITGRHHNEKI